MDGGYIFLGLRWPLDSYLLKTDSNGEIEWLKAIFDNTGWLWGNSIIQNIDSTYFILGKIRYTPNGYSDINLSHISKIGNMDWSNNIIFASAASQGTYIQITSDNNLILTGYAPVGSSLYKLFLTKTDLSGNILWTKPYFGTAQCVKQTTDNHYIVSGFGSGDALLLKTDENGLLTSQNDNHLLNYQYSPIYPNPCSDHVNIRTQNGDYELALYSLDGQNILSQLIDGSFSKVNERDLIKLNVSGVPIGIYLLEIKNSQQTRLYKLLIR